MELLRTIEESYFKQKSRITWLKEGDLNTTFVHRLVQVRASFNSIRSFTLPSGDQITDHLAMGLMAVSHFQNLLAPEALPVSHCSVQWFQSILQFRCQPAHAQNLMKIPDVAEITRVIMKPNADEAPGPDGFTSGFLKAVWNLIGAETVDAILGFFQIWFPTIGHKLYHPYLGSKKTRCLFCWRLHTHIFLQYIV